MTQGSHLDEGIPRQPHALITGASSGLGLEIARQLARDRGYTALATARRLDRLESLTREFPPGQVQILAGDLSSPEFRDQLWRWAIERSGGVEILINNAGLGHYSAFARETYPEMQRMVDVNLLAVLDLTQRAVAHMLGHGRGQVVQISSVLGSIGMTHSATYVATKHAVDGLVKSLRYELKGTGVRVWAAQPGPTRSEFHAVASGETAGHSREIPFTASTEKTARAIIRGLDRRTTFLAPTWTAALILTVARWLPVPFHWFMERWTPGYVRTDHVNDDK